MNFEAGNARCMHSVVGPTLASLPYFVRAVQCYRAYLSTGSSHHLVNLGKYLSSFPVIWTSALKHQLAPMEGVKLDKHDQYLQLLWLYTVTINTLYSFLWDVLMDWGLCRSPRARHVLLRDDLLFQRPWVYYGAIVNDLALRLCWSLKLSSHLQQHASGACAGVPLLPVKLCYPASRVLFQVQGHKQSQALTYTRMFTEARIHAHTHTHARIHDYFSLACIQCVSFLF